MSTTQPNPLFTRSEKGRFGRTMKKRVRGAARKGLSKIFGIPLSRGLGAPSAKSSRRSAHRTTAPARGSYPSTSVRSDVISALRGQGYSAGVAKKMAEGVRDGDTFESGFRRVISRNPAELIIFGNPAKVYGRKTLLAMKRTSNPIPAALLTAFESAAGSKLFDEVASKRKNSEQRNYREERAQELLKVRRALAAAGYKAGVKHGRGTAHSWLEIRLPGHVFTKEVNDAVLAIAKRASGRTFRAAEEISVDFDLRRNPAKKKNPADRETQLFETFHHREAEGVFERQRSAKQRKGYTILGPLVAIGINPEYFDKMEARAGKKQFADWAVEHYDQLPRLDFMTPGQVDEVKNILGDPEKYIQDCPLLASSPNGRQLYALAEDVQIDLSKFETDAGKDYVDLGDATFVVYIAKKPHEVREWVHMMGEDGGTRPRLMYDRLRKEVCFIGGSYVVKAPGIMH